MPIQIACPNCQRPLRVPDDLLGQQVKCPGCATEFQAAVEESPAASESLSERAADEPPRERATEGYRERLPTPPRRPERDKYDDADDFDDEPRRRRDYKPHRGTLILVLGILSLFITWSFWGLGIVVAIPAWIMGTQDLKQMDAGIMDPTGRSNTNTGRVLGMISTVLSVFCCVGGGAWIALMIATGR